VLGFKYGDMDRIAKKFSYDTFQECLNKNPDIVKRMADEGHLVCNHTSNHKDITKLRNDEIIANLSRIEEQYKQVTGYDMEKIFRFPEGRYDLETLELLQKNGYKTVFWSMAYDDWDNSRQMDEERAKEKLLSTTHNGAIILLHPTSSTNAAILSDLIREWKSIGYTFGSLKDL
jgi:peptidoglycan-N-acetylmuramic acid deacetylase